MTNDELNRKISEARDEWHTYESVNGIFNCRGTPVDWTGSEVSSAMLRNELKSQFPYFSITFNRDRHKIEFEASGVAGGFAVDISTDDELRAIADAWLKWFEAKER